MSTWLVVVAVAAEEAEAVVVLALLEQTLSPFGKIRVKITLYSN